MGSIFSEDDSSPQPLPEEKFDASRLGPQPPAWYFHLGKMQLFLGLVFIVLLVLLCMDPFIFAYQKGKAIPAYIYLNNHGVQPEVNALVHSGMFSGDDLDAMNHHTDNSFASVADAKAVADSAIAYMSNVNALQNGQYDDLDTIGKVRCLLFVKIGIVPPTDWAILDPPAVTPVALADSVKPVLVDRKKSPQEQLQDASKTMQTVADAIKDASK